MLRSTLFGAAAVLCAATPALAAPVQNWTGFYVGVNAGFGGDKFKYPASGTFVDTAPDEDSDTGTTTFSGSGSQTSSGFVGGGQVGYNFQVGSGWLLGAEADIAASGIQGKTAISGSSTGGTSGSASGQISTKIDYFGTVRARVGVPIADGRFVPYLTGGLAYGRVSSNASLDIVPTSTSGTATHFSESRRSTRTGWTVGAGAEYALSNNLSFRVEYLYMDLGTKTVLDGSISGGQTFGGLGSIGDGDETLTGTVGAKATSNVIRVGVNYRFGG